MAFSPTDLPCPVAPASKKVRHFGQIHHENLVRDGFTQRDGQFVVRLAELPAVQNTFHRHHAGPCIRHFYTDSPFARYGSDDTDAQCAQAQCDVILQILIREMLTPFCRGDFVQRDGRSHRSFYGRYAYARNSGALQ